MLTAVSTPDLHLLRVFIAVTESGGFSRAQIALNVSQSTISTQMADLEHRLGLTLCRRGRAGFVLTEEGREIYQAAKDLFRDCGNFAGRVNSLRGDITGELRIATADALLGHPAFSIEKTIAELGVRMPEVSLQLSVMDPLEIERLVLEQQLHAGIHTFPNHAPGLRYKTLFCEKQTLYCGKGHPLFDAKEMPTIEELEQHDYATRTYYGGSLRTGRFHPKSKHASSGNMDGIVALILSGRFLGHIPDQSAAPWLKQNRIRALLDDELSYNSEFECVFPTGTKISRAQQILEEVLIESVSDQPGE